MAVQAVVGATALLLGKKESMGGQISSKNNCIRARIFATTITSCGQLDSVILHCLVQITQLWELRTSTCRYALNISLKLI